MDKNKTLVKIIIFDGVCLLCNSVVYFLHKRLRYSNYKFIASQTDLGHDYVHKFNLGKIIDQSIVLIVENSIFIKSDVVFMIIDDLPLKWSILKVFKIIPKSINDFFYDQISKYRHIIFGKVNNT